MKALAAALLVFIAACGEGRAVLNVDVLSFMTAVDSTTPYNIPGGVTVDSSFFRMVLLPPGFGRSSVDSVTASGAASLENASGGGSIIFNVFFAKQQGILFSGSPYLSANGSASGAQTVPLIPQDTISVADTVFNTDTLFVGIRGRITTNAGPNMVGQFRITDLRLRIVLQDRVF